jgi:DUF971 family protein
MKPDDIQHIGADLAIKWADGAEDFIPLEKLRRACPCAVCKGEVDIMGNLYKNAEVALTAKSFGLTGFVRVGGYAIQPVWGDGHNTGIYSFDYLHRVAVAK